MNRFFLSLILSFALVSYLSSQDLHLNWKQRVVNDYTNSLSEIYPNEICTDDFGNTFLIGNVSASANFGGLYSSNYPSDSGSFFISKYNNWGGLEWVKKISGVWGRLNSIKTNQQNELFCYLSFSSSNPILIYEDGDSIQIDRSDSLDVNGMLLLKFSNNGDLLWSKILGRYLQLYSNNPYSNSNMIGGELHVCNNGDVVVVGRGVGEVELNENYTGGELNVGQSQPLIVRYDTDGNYIWSKAFSGDMNPQNYPRGDIYKVQEDANSNLYLSGVVKGVLDFDPGNGVDSIGGSWLKPTPFLVKLDGLGDYQWCKIAGGENQLTHNYTYNNEIAVNSNGDIYWTGTFEDTVNLDPSGGQQLEVSKGLYDFYISKFNSNGSLLWTKVFGGPLYDVVNHIELENGNRIYIVGEFEDSLDLNSSSALPILISKGRKDGFLQVLDTNGTTENVFQFGFSADEKCLSLLVNDNTITVTGTFKDSLDLGFSNSNFISNPNFHPNLALCDGFFLANYSLGYLGISESKEMDINLYPNPSNGDFIASIYEESKYFVYDVNGRMIDYGDIDELNNKISISNKGVFFIHIYSDSFSIVKKVIVN